MTWTRRLLALLEGPDRQQAARLLELFASPSDIPELTAVVLDQTRDPWVRTYVLRAFEERALPLDRTAHLALVAEVATAEGRFAQPDVAATLAAIATPTFDLRRPSPAMRPFPLVVDGDVETLFATAETAPHVVLRARAIRALHAIDPRPAGYTALCLRALGDREQFELFYAPAISEAAIGLARHPEVDEQVALEALVEAGLRLDTDDAWWAIAAAIRSWVDHRPATIQPVWYERY